MRVAIHHFLAAVPDPLLDYSHRRCCHDQSTDSVVPEAVHTAPFQPEFSEQWVKMLVENCAVRERRIPFRPEDEPFGSAILMLLQHLHNVWLYVDPADSVLGLG